MATAVLASNYSIGNGTLFDRNFTNRFIPRCSSEFNPPYHISAIVFSFFIFIINTLVLFLIMRNKKLRKTPANYLLLSFALNDLFSGFSIVVHVLPHFYIKWHGCIAYRKIFRQEYMIGAHMTSYLLLLNAVGHLLLLSSERFVSLYYALRYHSMVTSLRICLACCFTWLLASLMTLIQLFWIIPFVTSPNPRALIPEFRMHTYRYTLVIVIAFFFIPFVVLITQYTWLFLLIRRLVQSAPGTKKTNRSLKERKALVIYCAMFLCFLICCFPYMTIQLLTNIDHNITREMPSEFLEGVFLLRYIVSIVNPLLYTLYKRDFRNAVKSTLMEPICKILIKDYKPSSGRNIYLSTRDANITYVDHSTSKCKNNNNNNSLNRGCGSTSAERKCLLRP